MEVVVLRTDTLRCRRPVVLSHTFTNLSREAEAKRPILGRHNLTGPVASTPPTRTCCALSYYVLRTTYYVLRTNKNMLRSPSLSLPPRTKKTWERNKGYKPRIGAAASSLFLSISRGAGIHLRAWVRVRVRISGRV